jgi:mono/diheme cytochrome c family protein
MRRCMFWIFTLTLFSVSALHAQDIVSVWQGTFKSASEQHRVLVQISKTDSGLAVAAVYIEFFPDAICIDSSMVNASDLKFTINKEKGTYEGKVSADGSSVEGRWTWDRHPVALELRRTTKQAAWPVPFQYQYHYMEVTYARPTPDEARIPFSPRLAVDYMEQGAMAWTGERQCVACHTNGSYMVVRPLMTPQLGAPQKELRDFFVATLREALALDPAKLQTDVEPTQIVYVAAGLAIWDAHVLHRLSPETVQALDLMFKLQRPTGDWFIEDDNNPPLESSPFQLATVAARAVTNAPGG